MPGVAGYTSEMCQQAMVEEMEALFKGRTFSGQQGMKPLKIYKQFIPIQTDDDDNIDTNESPYPCLIVKETSGTIKKLTAKTQQVLIQLIFCAYDQNVDRQGYVDAVNIKEAIIQHSYAAKMLNPNKTIQVTLRAALQSENKDGGSMYSVRKWVDRVTQFVNRFKETNNSDGSVTHERVDGEVLTVGTAQSAENFNHMEEGILEGSLLLAEHTRVMNEHCRDIEAMTGEMHLIYLYNSAKYPANNSKKTIALKQQRNNTDYTVNVRVVSAVMPNGVALDGDPAGTAGNIIVTDKLLNGFKIAYTGNAKEVTLEVEVQGGMIPVPEYEDGVAPTGEEGV